MSYLDPIIARLKTQVEFADHMEELERYVQFVEKMYQYQKVIDQIMSQLSSTADLALMKAVKEDGMIDPLVLEQVKIQGRKMVKEMKEYQPTVIRSTLTEDVKSQVQIMEESGQLQMLMDQAIASFGVTNDQVTVDKFKDWMSDPSSLDKIGSVLGLKLAEN